VKTIHQKIQIPEVILGIHLPELAIRNLQEGKETELIKGFQHKSGETFDAYLNLNSENKLVFRIAESEKFNAFDEKENIKTRISLAEIALDLEFKPVLNSGNQEISVYDYLLMERPEGDRIIVHKDQKTQEFKFFALDLPGVEGNVFQFLDTFTNQTAEQNRKYLEKFQNPVRKNQFHFLPSISNLDTAFQSIFQLESLSNRLNFHEKGIRDTTLDHSFFRGRILQKIGSGNAVNESENVVFPIFRNGKISDFCFFNQTPTNQKGIWYSNVINPDKVRRLILFSHPLEALFYHQIYSKPSDLFTVYASLLGEKNEFQILELQKLIDYCKPENVIISTADDIQGLIWENALLGGLFEPREDLESLQILKEVNSEIRFSIHSLKERANAYCSLDVFLTYNDPEKGMIMNENLFKYFTQINEKEIKEHPELENKAPFLFGKRILSRHESFAPIYFPNKKEYLELVSRVIQHLRPILYFKVEKPKLGLFEKTLKYQNEERQVFKELKTRKLG